MKNNKNKGKCDLLKAQIKAMERVVKLVETTPKSATKHECLFDLGFQIGMLQAEHDSLEQSGRS